MRKFKNPVVVLGGGLAGLWLLRAFGRRGIDTYLVADRKDAALFSKYCRRAFIFPSMRRNLYALKKFLEKMRNNLNRRAVIYPTSDLDALNLSKLKDELYDDFHFVVGDQDSVRLLVDKSRFYRALDQNGMSFPVTYFPEDVEDVRRIGAKITYPTFIKPSITQLFNAVFGSGKGFIANSSRELIDYYQLATKHGIGVLFQEIIPGPPNNSYQLEGCYDKTYSPIVLFARQRLRVWPLDFGNTTLCVSIPLKELAKEKGMVNKLIRIIGYQGLMSAEFKEDARDGILKLLEINARAWWHFWLSAKCGADIIFSSYLDAIGEKTKLNEKYETGVKSVYFLADSGISVKMFLRGDLGFSSWVSSLKGPKEYTFLQRDDLAPFVMDSANLGFRTLIKGITLFQCSREH